jgi:uncharacterized RmlC-like cupin family protein
MSYVDHTGEISAVLRTADDITSLTYPNGTDTRFTAPGSATAGQFGLFEWNMIARTARSDGHFHKTFSESFYIVSGQVELFDGEKWAMARPGDFLYVPMGGIHAFCNPADEEARMLVLFAPAPPREKYFEALAEISESGRVLTDAEWTELYAEHDQYMV